MEVVWEVRRSLGAQTKVVRRVMGTEGSSSNELYDNKYNEKRMLRCPKN